MARPRFLAKTTSTTPHSKRVFGLRRVTWKGKPSFDSYVGLSVVSANLLVLARHLTT